MRKICRGFLVLVILVGTHAITVRADEISDWNAYLFEAARLAVPPTSPLVITRSAAIFQASVFDAVNGIERRYTPIHVEPAAPRGASTRAAAVQAAYAILVKLYPAQKPDLDAKRAASLAAISHNYNDNDDHDQRGGRSIPRGIAWGQTVADAIFAWRSTDGFTPPPPPFFGGMNVGQWRPTPPGFLSGAGVQFAYMTPWVIASPSQFRTAGPPALTSARYTTDYNEVKSKGSLNSVTRTDDETLYARFWALSTASAYWNYIARSLAEREHLSLSKRSRLFAFVNLSMADAAIGCWESKYNYVFWRPVTAIPLGNTDGNPDTIEDPSFTTLLVTPNHPETPSGHSCVSGAAGRVLSQFFGDNTSFDVISDAPEMAGVVRSYGSFTQALEEIKNARIFAGIHFRSACNDGQQLGIGVADYVRSNALQKAHGNDDDN